MKKLLLHKDEQIIAVVPQHASGPGWSNRPLWVYIRQGATGKLREECIQPEEQTAEMYALWAEEERFSGKRPFGNSGWSNDLFDALARAKFINMGPLDQDGRSYKATEKQIRAADAYVHDLILAAFYGVSE